MTDLEQDLMIAQARVKQLEAEIERLKAAEPVRCWECLHMDEIASGIYGCSYDGGITGIVELSDFCSYGERKDGAE